MALKRSTSASSGGSSAASSDFIISVGSSGYTTTTLSQDFPVGTYVVTSALGDSTYDIYLLTSAGANAGNVSTSAASTSVTASAAFNKVVVYGATNNDTLTFQFKYVFSPSADDTTTTVIGPRITSLSTSVLAKADDSTTITGKNFASNVAVTFTGTDNTIRNAKSVTRNSSTSLTVVRPDDFPNAYQPYTITVSNPGVSSPTSTNSNRLSATVTAGSIPVWTTSAGTLGDLVVNNSSYTSTLVATDVDAGSAVTYSIVSGALPSGLSLNGSTGAITGTCTASYAFYNFTVRVTDAGGNYVDRAFSVQNYPASDSDNFNRSAGSLGSTSTKAQVWVTDRGAWYTNGSSAQSDTDPGTYPVAHITAPSVNKTASVSSQPGTGVAFWVQDTNNWWGSVPYYATGSTTNTSTTCSVLTLDTTANCGGGSGTYWACSQVCNGGAERGYYSYNGQQCANYSNFYCNSGSRGGFAYYYNFTTGQWGYNNTSTSVTNTNYTTYLRTIRNNGGSISDYDMHQHNTNTSGYVDITSIIISTSNGTISVTGTASRTLTPGNPSTSATGFGIIKAGGGSRQASTVDDFSLS